MSRTRFIYFLSAIVLIIGCFALNTSYSLFVDNDSTQLVETTVPTITDEVTLSLSSIEVEGTKEYLIKQTITNNNSIPMGFRLTASSDSTTYQVQSTTYNGETYLSYGTVEANSTKDIYLRVANTNEDTSNIATINFSLESDYATLKMNTEEYLASANIDNQTQFEIVLGDLPYSDNQDTLTYKIIKRQADKNGVGLSSIFAEQNPKVTLPIESSFNVPTLTTVTDVETEDVGLYQAEDDYGTSYFYRGANEYNYINFAGMCWRIVGIRGDGAVKLILEDYYTICNDNDTSENDLIKYTGDWSIGDGNFGYQMINNKYLFSYVNPVIKANYSASKYFYDFQINKLQNHLNYLKSGNWCFGSTKLYTRSGNYQDYTFVEIESPTYNTTRMYYESYKKFNNSQDNETFTLKCNGDNLMNFIDVTFEKNLIINEAAMYVGMLTAEEMILAGASNSYNDYSSKNNIYLLNDYAYNNSIYFWSLTPSYYGGRYDYAFVFEYNGAVSEYGAVDGDFDGSGTRIDFRPSINLKENILWESGDGTQNTPYTVKLN